MGCIDSKTGDRTAPATPSQSTVLRRCQWPAVYLTGSHTWLNLVDAGWDDPPPAFDYELWLRFLERQNPQLFPPVDLGASEMDCQPDTLYYGPSPYLRTGPGRALDGNPSST